MSVIGIDLGGTKIAAAFVSPKGKILEECREPTQLQGGWPVLRKQIVAICRGLQERRGKITAVGIGSAGPLHAPSGMLLDPTNFGWTGTLRVSVTKDLGKALQLPVRLENDAAAAAIAEHWQGNAGDDFVVLTLGTGLGVGVFANGRLVRGGRELHPEGGHLLIRPGDPSAPCGCGNFGCAEAFLSGTNFAKRAAKALGIAHVDGKQLAELSKINDPGAKRLFAEYSRVLAEFMHNLVVLYYPKKIILTGSFAQAHQEFLPNMRTHLRSLLERRQKTIPLFPTTRISKLGNRSGVLGSAYIALHCNKAEE